MTNEQAPESEPIAADEQPATPTVESMDADAPTVVTAEVPAAPTAAPTTPMAAQPAVPWQSAPAVAAVKGQRTMLAGIAGVLLLLGGILGILLGVLVAVVGGAFISNLGAFTQFPGLTDAPELGGANAGAIIGGAVAFFGLLVVAYSVAYLLAGIGVLRNSDWARVLGIVVSALSALIWASGLRGAGEIRDAGGAAGGGLFVVVALAIHVYIVVALLFFWRTKRSTA